jgi:hypothetical protein
MDPKSTTSGIPGDLTDEEYARIEEEEQRKRDAEEGFDERDGQFLIGALLRDRRSGHARVGWSFLHRPRRANSGVVDRPRTSLQQQGDQFKMKSYWLRFNIINVVSKKPTTDIGNRVSRDSAIQTMKRSPNIIVIVDGEKVEQPILYARSLKRNKLRPIPKEAVAVEIHV